MTSPVFIIAEREFRTYVATMSFWLSLAIAPLGAAGVFLFTGHQQSPALVTIQSSDRGVTGSARQALEEAARLEGQSFVFGQGGASIILSSQEPRVLDVAFGADFPLSPVGRAMVRHVIERDAARRTAGDAVLETREKSDAIVTSDTGALSRLIAMTMLWLMLTGSLGMLLQAVVRERANRALESLLACARARQIVTGKILGVGAVSLLVLAAWGGSVALLSLFAAKDGALANILAGFSNPLMLARDALIYVCAFAFYGAATVMFGALARDSASAQNLARPIFVLLLAVFFAALASTAQPGAWPWLVYVPPFTPFLLLVKSYESVAVMTQLALLGGLLMASLVFVWFSARLLSIAPHPYQIFRRNFRNVQPAV